MSKKNQVRTESKTQEVVDWAAIDALEKQARIEANVVALETANQEDNIISFDEWWLSREADLKKPSYFKEILKVDMKARGLSKKELVSKWDWAARQFGLVF
jgi:hypothetical protein